VFAHVLMVWQNTKLHAHPLSAVVVREKGQVATLLAVYFRRTPEHGQFEVFLLLIVFVFVSQEK
jgi:hypothetical protein